MARRVLVTDNAARDPDEIFAPIARHNTPRRAGYVFARIERAIAGLAQAPNWGAVPAELSALGIRDYREVFFKPYRIVYRVRADAVAVLLIADGRRDLQSLLQRRLLEP